MLSNKFFQIILLYTLTFSGVASTYLDDAKSTLTLTYHASYKQFQKESSFWTLMASTPLFLYSFEQDKELVERYGKEQKGAEFEVLDALGTITNMQIIPFGIYFYSKSRNLERSVKLAMDTVATTLLVNFETVVLSLMDIHKRPKEENLSFWETGFRGDSSFPSGHIIPSLALTLKTYEYYGITASIAPAILTLAMSYERVQSRKHYVSDIIGTFVLTSWASTGVRKHRSDTELIAKSNWSFVPMISHKGFGAFIGKEF